MAHQITSVVAQKGAEFPDGVDQLKERSERRRHVTSFGQSALSISRGGPIRALVSPLRSFGLSSLRSEVVGDVASPKVGERVYALLITIRLCSDMTPQ